MGSGIPYPLSFWHILRNIQCILVIAIILVRGKRVAEFMRMRKRLGLKPPPFVQTSWDTTLQTICPSIHEVDYPMYVPPNLTLCGPIVLDAPPLSEVDPNLHEWIAAAPTILVNMGSHYEYTEVDLRAFFQGVMAGMPSHCRVVWKVPGMHDKHKGSWRS